MLKAFKYLLTFLVVICFFLFIGISVLALFGKEQVKELVMKQINKQLNTELLINGSTSVSFFKGFPQIAFTLNDVAIKDKFKIHDNLLEAEQLSFLFNVKDYFNNEINIADLELDNAQINIAFDEKGRSNYEIFNTVGKKNYLPSGKVKSAYGVNLFAENANIDFTQKGKDFQLDIEGGGVLNAILSDTFIYCKNKPIAIDLGMLFNNDENTYTFGRSSFEIDENEFGIEGDIELMKLGYELNLNFEGKNLDINRVISLSDNQAHSYFEDWELDGNADINTSIIGYYGNNQDLSAITEATANLDISDLKWLKIEAQNISSFVCFDDGILNVDQLLFEMMEGKGDVDAIIDLEEQSMRSHVRIGGINLKAFLEQYNDFEEYISPDNLEGTLDLNMLLKSGIDKKFNLDKDATKGWVDFEIKNAQLVNFTPIVSMLEGKDQQRVKALKFGPIKNQLIIDKRVIRIPKMDINSNLVNIDFSGKYSMQNSLNFHFKVDIMDYFNKKFFKKNKEVSEKKRGGGLNYYCSLFGDPNKPVFKGKSKNIIEGEFQKDSRIEKIDINQYASERYNFSCAKE